MRRVQDVVHRCAPLAVALVLGLAPACTGDGASRSSPTASSPAESPAPSSSPSPTPSASGQTLTVELWFTRGHELFETRRTIPETQAVGTAALTELIAGPTGQEAAASVHSQVPPDTELLGLSIEAGVATVNLNDEFSLGDSDFSQRARLGQVVYTLTQFPTVRGVIFELEGSPILTFDRHGPVHRPSLRKDYRDLLPAILVESPTIGREVSSPITVSGTADVFEAVVSIRILDQTGHVVASTVAMATCGSGCRGEYSKEVGYSVDGDQPGTVMVFEASAENGRAINVQRIPVVLSD